MPLKRKTYSSTVKFWRTLPSITQELFGVSSYNNFRIRTMTFFYNFLKLTSHLPWSFKNTDGFIVFKGNGKFFNSADTSAPANDCITRASEEDVAAGIPKAC